MNQAQNMTTSGFLPNLEGADKNFGTCFQCAAIDRARYKVSPTIARSDICTNCFKQYCFNPDSPPDKSAIVGRKYEFKDPDPQGVTKVKGFFSRHKAPIIAGVVILAVLIIASIFILCVPYSSLLLLMSLVDCFAYTQAEIHGEKERQI